MSPIPEGLPSDTKHHAGTHIYRAGNRAASLYPFWLPTQERIKHSTQSWIHTYFLRMRLFFNKVLERPSTRRVAQESFLRALIVEQKLRSLTRHDHEWQTNLTHQLRQEQLISFEDILKAFLKATSQSNYDLHPFPEIILVMAQTLVEAGSTPSPLVTSAQALLQSYNHLRGYIFNQSLLWRPHFIRLVAADELISQVLEFYTAWVGFRHQRSLLIKKQDLLSDKFKKMGESLCPSPSSSSCTGKSL